MSPQGGKLIYYKYPNNVGTTNNKVYNLKNKSMKFVWIGNASNPMSSRAAKE